MDVLISSEGETATLRRNNLRGERDEREPNMVSPRTSPPQREGLAETKESLELGSYGQPKKMLV